MDAPEKEALVWKIRNFPGGKEYLLRCKFGLPSVAAEEEASGRMPPIRVAYEIPYFTVSGIQVGDVADSLRMQVCGRKPKMVQKCILAARHAGSVFRSPSKGGNTMLTG